MSKTESRYHKRIALLTKVLHPLLNEFRYREPNWSPMSAGAYDTLKNATAECNEAFPCVVCAAALSEGWYYKKEEQIGRLHNTQTIQARSPSREHQPARDTSPKTKSKKNRSK